MNILDRLRQDIYVQDLIRGHIQGGQRIFAETDLYGLAVYQGIRWYEEQVVMVVSGSRERILLERYLDNLDMQYVSIDLETLPMVLERALQSRCIIMEADVLAYSCMSPEVYHRSTVRWVTGTVIDADWSKRLVGAGYSRVEHIVEPGQYAQKGELIEVWTHAGLYRIALFDTVIEKIWRVDPYTKEKEVASLCELRPIVMGGDDTIISYLMDAVWCMYEYEQISAQIVRSVQGTEPMLSPDLIERLRMIEQLTLQCMPYFFLSLSDTQGVRLMWRKPAPPSRQFAVAGFGDSRSIWCVTRQVERLQLILSEHGMEVGETDRGVYIIEDEIVQGLDMTGTGRVILSSSELFGVAKEQKKKKKTTDFSQLVSLEVGEYVVHIDHGIGRFTGFGTIIIDQIEREYIYIEYERGDTIYVPLDQADKITKYISVGNEQPKLSSLSTHHWERVRAKVKHDTEQIAKELLEIQALRTGVKKIHYQDDHLIQERLAESFEHILTLDQQRAIHEILDDMMQSTPMDRLLVGDVGYGKTEVAIRAVARAVAAGYQVAVLVPTTILAEQHVQTFERRLGELGVRVASLSRFVSRDLQKVALRQLKDGQIDVLIGTHRVLSRDVVFKNLALVIIDEEQKFGVKHKEKLKSLRAGVDILTMTATPIPRTLYFGLSGLKEISLIQTPPEGRLSVQTSVVKKTDEVIRAAIQQELDRDGQIFIVHNRVETIEAFAYKIAQIVPGLTYRVAHGQMPEERLAGIINDFAAGEFQALICSTIIESGLDISRVNTLIIDQATRFGLSQLHQLRGRIGRGHVQAYAYFLYTQEELVGNAQRRLESILKKGELGSGYELSLEDLDIRGSGNILGREQSGNMQMVGVGYYMKMLEEAVETLKSGATEEKQATPVLIDLAISAYIPQGYYPSEDEKIRAYQQLAIMDTEEELDEYRSRELARIGVLPQEYEHLIEIARLKIRAQRSGVISMVTQKQETISGDRKRVIVVQFDHDVSAQERSDIMAISGSWQIEGRVARIAEKTLGDRWLDRLLLLMNFLSHLR